MATLEQILPMIFQSLTKVFSLLEILKLATQRRTKDLTLQIKLNLKGHLHFLNLQVWSRKLRTI